MFDPIEGAKAYWRYEPIIGFCCESDDCIYDFCYLTEADTGAAICRITSQDHGFEATLRRNGDWTLGWADFVNSRSLTIDETLFWDQMAKCYSELPYWFIRPEDGPETEDKDSCKCALKIIMALGCQCGGA